MIIHYKLFEKLKYIYKKIIKHDKNYYNFLKKVINQLK